jgi:protein dithiol oxidoreductase (disulfide-forming)
MHSLTRALVVPVLAALAFLPLACSAEDKPAKSYELGVQYKAVRTPQPTANPAKIEVMEVFAYSCPHCFQFEPKLAEWLKKKPGDVEFVRMPHTLGQPANILRNKAFYAAQMLGVFDKFHPAMFGAIHSKGKTMATPEEIRALFVESTGVKAEDFDGAFSSFAVDAGFRRGETSLQAMAIASVPSLIIEGKYITNPRSGGFDEMIGVTNYLIEQARKERKSQH